ncbi:MAG TPA: transposase [Pyrinomonadaceae bacterium]
MPKKKKKKTSEAEARKRSAIRQANRTEKTGVEDLLKLLCATIPDREYAGIGAKPIQLRDIVYCLIYKVYTLWATERSAANFEELLKKGLITRVPKNSCLHQFFNDESLILLLNGLLGKTSMPLILFDMVYSIDSTHFIQERYLPYWRRYPNAYTVKKAGGKKYINLHVLAGQETLIITSAIPASMKKPERDFFRPLVEKTLDLRAKAAKIQYPNLPEEVERAVELLLKPKPLEVLADKGYTGRKVKKAARDLGVTLIVTEKRKSRDKKIQVEMTKKKGRRRNSIESIFNMVKNKFRRELLSKNEVSSYNETLCKVICHNLIVLHRYQVRTGEKISFE